MVEEENNGQRLEREFREIEELHKQILALESQLDGHPKDNEIKENIEDFKNLHQNLLSYYLAHCEFLIKNKMIDADLAEKMIKKLTGALS